MRLLFHDIDGCLNADVSSSLPIHTGTFSEKEKKLLGLLGQRMDCCEIDHLIINTGRSLEDTLPFVSAIGTDKLSFLIVEHGAIVFDVFANRTLSPNTHQQTKLAEMEQLINWFTDTGQEKLNNTLGEQVATITKKYNLTFLASNSCNDQRLYDEIRSLISTSPFALDNFVMHHSRSDRIVDVMSSINKGDGVDCILKLPGIDATESIAVGNGLNDLPMMYKADFCVCPSNSELDVINYCHSHKGIVSQTPVINATIEWLDTLA